MDYNFYETTSNTSQRLSESLEDMGAALYSSIDWFFDENKPSTHNHCSNILNTAERALEHDDQKEAAYQLKRELFFARENLNPGNRYEQAALAGLASIQQGDSANKVAWNIDAAFLNLEKPPEYKKGHQIPSYVEYSKSFGKGNIQELAEYHCTRILGIEAPMLLKAGLKDAAITELKRSQYLAEKYIPETDRFETTSFLSLDLLDDGALTEPVLRMLQPYMTEVEQNW